MRSRPGRRDAERKKMTLMTMVKLEYEENRLCRIKTVLRLLPCPDCCALYIYGIPNTSVHVAEKKEEHTHTPNRQISNEKCSYTAVPCGIFQFLVNSLILEFGWRKIYHDLRAINDSLAIFAAHPLLWYVVLLYFCVPILLSQFSSSDFHCCLPFHQHKRSSSMWAHLTLNEFCCVHLYAHRESRYCMVMHLWMRKKVENKMKKNTELWYIFFDLVQNWIFHSKIHTDTLTSVYALWHCDAV